MELGHLGNIEAEQALLGAVLVRAGVLGELPHIGAGDFFEPLHGRLFEVMRRLVSEGVPLTPTTIMPAFQYDAPIGGLTVVQYIGRLAASATTTINAAAYAATILDLSARRELVLTGDRLTKSAGVFETPVAQTGASAICDLDAVLTRANAQRKTYASGGEWAAQLVEDIWNGDGTAPVSTGLIDLDTALGGGLRKGELYILAGRPSMGKTALCSEILINAAKAGFRSEMFSLEMKAKDGIMARCLSSRVYNRDTPIPYLDIMRHLAYPERKILSEHAITRLTEAAEYFKSLPFGIDEQAGLTVAEIVARSRQRQADFIIVDHMGKVRPTSRYAGIKRDEVGETSGSLAVAAKSLNVAILALCQLNRGQEGQENKRPGLSNLRDSGEIEQDADGVFFAFRPSYYLERTRENSHEGEMDRQELLEASRCDFEVSIGKQRSGPCVTVDLWASMANNAIRNKLR